MSKGVLLVNLGTPDSPAVADVRRYLGEFLMDPHVINTPWVIRKAIVSLFILPFRPKASAHAYASIWDPEHGSPLLHESQQLQQGLKAQVDMPCELAMRYGQPNISSALHKLADQGVTELLLIPLYPHHADSTRTTTIEATRAQLPAQMTLEVLPPFFAHPGYIHQLAASIRPYLEEPFDHLLLSYHGLPEQHLSVADPTGSHCLKVPNCCETPSPAHSTCYRHQVLSTSTALGQALGVESKMSVSFQSRLGRLPWLTPYTDARLRELPKEGVRDLLVACPAFVADNLETLEEIALQGSNTFTEAGGHRLRLIPCLNSTPGWIETLANWCTQGFEAQSLNSLS